MSAPNDGGPAFPVADIRAATPRTLDQEKAFALGLSLRDYFAAKAMQGFIAEPVDGIQESMVYELSEKTCAAFAAASYSMADAMLAERAK